MMLLVAVVILPEVGAGRIEVRVAPLHGVEQVLDVHADLELPPAAEVEVAHDVRVHQEHRGPAHAVDAEREAALLERRRLPAGVALEAGVDVEPGLGQVDRAVALQGDLRVVLGDAVQVAVEEQVAPVEQRTGLVLERAAGLPSAEELRGHAAVVQERLGLAERQLVDRAAAETPRPGVLAGLPQRRLAVVGFDRPVLRRPGAPRTPGWR